MSRRSSDSKSGAGMVGAIVVAMASFAFVAWLPLRRGSAACQVIGGLAIAGGLASVVWWVPTHDQPSAGLFAMAVGSGIAYAMALVLRLTGSISPSSNEDVAAMRFADGVRSLQTGHGEVVLFQSDAQLLGDKQVRAFGGVSTRLGLGLRGGAGSSVPIRTIDVVDQGELVVTTERIVMAGKSRTKSLKLNRVLDARVVDDRLVVRPMNGKSMIVEVRQPEAAARAIRSALTLNG